MVLSVASRSLFWIFLLHLCILSTQDTVKPKTLANIVKAFEKTLKFQYTVVLRVEKEKCKDESYSGGDLKIEEVKKTLEEKKDIYESDNLIAASPYEKEHSEYRLKDKLAKILNVKDKCVIYFTVSSPCLKTCLAEKGAYNIEKSLKLLQDYVGIKALVFKKVWEHDKLDDLKDRLKAIASDLPCYKCEDNKDCVSL